MIFANTYHLNVTVEWITQISIQSQLARNGKTKKVIRSKVVCPNIFFEYVPNSITVYNSEYYCECEECINLNFSSCLKEAIQLKETVEQVNVGSNTEIEEKNDCQFDEDTEQANHIYEFKTIPSFVAVITNEVVYTIKVTEKGRSTQVMSDMYGHKISKGEL